ncbi:hypothetical protein QR680_015951 [Steinernema hermaphroditum]|uniref:Uncharacterized protein n=1 Tax=Steinernema hermaphroditum TaxID=289476 RepID=A0AA39H9T3_9BILA|nr:hypothetical protein QR680_015951 [Steinernema hermaphroditum]
MVDTVETATIPYAEFVEIILNLLCPFFNFYLIYLLRRPFFHINLRILLVNFSVSLVLHAFTRVLIIIYEHNHFLSPTTYRAVLFLNRACVFCVMDASVVIALERVVATWMVDRYEAIQHTSVVVALCVVMWFFNSGLSIATHTLVFMTSKSTYFLPLLLMFSTVLILNFLGAMSFIMIRIYNQKEWKYQLERKLTHRYQIAENVRTSWQMLVVSLVDFAISVFFFCALFRVIMYSSADMTAIIMVQIFTLIVGASGILLPSFIIKTHPRLLLNVKLHFCRNVIDTNVYYRTSVESAEIETNIHFQQLKLSWA